MYGFTREEAEGRVSHDLLRTEFPEPLQKVREKFAADGHWAGELRHTCANGSKITVSTRWVAERNASGNIASILESNRDITESKWTQEAQARLAAIVESSEDAIVSKDLDGIIINWNKAAERIFGYTAEEAIGQHITLIVPPDRLDEEADILASLRSGERIEHFETVRQRKDGTSLDVSVTISPVKDAQGRVIGASKVARDITERKRLASLLQEAELSGRLLQLQDEERRRIARELHDGAGQLLAALSMNVSSISAEESRLSPGVARSVAESRSLIDQAVSEIRTVSHLLHPPLLDEVGLRSALQEFVNGFGERSNISVALDLPSDLERLPREVELSIFGSCRNV
jgi:PAS domain S-box-containing protein